MSILVLNAGSSSLRFALFSDQLKELYRGHVDAIGQRHCHYRRSSAAGTEEKTKVKIKNHKEAVDFMLERLQKDGAIRDKSEIKKLAHRVVHGADQFVKPTLIRPKVLKKLKAISDLAPLHNPANITGIEAAIKALPNAKHFAIFDTAFHSTLPEKAYLYGLPYKLFKKEKIRRYSFHGISHEYVGQKTAELLRGKRASKVIVCHLGNGVSITAIKNGKSLDSSMGFTPLEGPMMGTRSGTIDPAIIFHLLRKGWKSDAIKEMLEKKSGFLGLSEIGSDIRSLRAKPKSEGTRRTFGTFSYQVAKIILSYIAALDGLPDAITFTAGIGENADYLRSEICAYLKPLGCELDPKANREHRTVISKKTSKIKVFVIKTNEELEMASEALKMNS